MHAKIGSDSLMTVMSQAGEQRGTTSGMRRRSTQDTGSVGSIHVWTACETKGIFC